MDVLGGWTEMIMLGGFFVGRVLQFQILYAALFWSRSSFSHLPQLMILSKQLHSWVYTFWSGSFAIIQAFCLCLGQLGHTCGISWTQVWHHFDEFSSDWLTLQSEFPTNSEPLNRSGDADYWRPPSKTKTGEGAFAPFVASWMEGRAVPLGHGIFT